MASTSPDVPNSSGPQAHDWLTGGGELGQLIRGYDWSQNPLGPIESWPQSLRSAVSILLPSKAQIALFWGPDLITLYNDAYRPVLGKKHPSALGMPVREVWSELWETGLRRLFEGVLNTGEAFWGRDWPFYLERGGFPEETFFDISYDPIRDESGRVAGLFCIVSETTARVISERRLSTLRDLSLSAPVESKSVEDACRAVAEILTNNRHDIPFALIYLLDETGQTARLAGISGLEAGTAAAPISVAISGSASDDPWSFNAAMQINGAIEITDVIECCGELPAGVWPEPPHTAMVMPIGASGQDRTVGFLVAGASPRRPLDDQYRAFFDLLTTQISTTIANARAYEEERRRAEWLAALDRAKTAFFSNISHEFRTPLTLLLGPVADVLGELDETFTGDQRESLEIAYRNGLRLQKLVNTLLDFSRIEAGRVQASYEPVNLSNLTAELASNFRSACERAGIELIVDCPSLDELVYVDPDMWEKIVLNLVSNAFKFTLSGRIEVRLRKSDTQVQLTVRDTGVGIPAEELPKVFERFHRVEVSRGRTQEGSGIGLALVCELVKLHGGTVSVESAAGKGSLFTVSLPRGKDHLPQERINAERRMASTSLGAAPFVSEALRWLPDSAGDGEPSLVTAHAVTREVADDGRFHVLLADDNADMRDYVSRLLADRYHVCAVADGQAALNAIEEHVPDLVLSDVMMPVLDGFELLRRIRANPQTREIPVVLLSARAGEESRIEGLEASADDYIVKPFSARELLATVDAHIKTVNIRRNSQQALAMHNKRLAVLWEAAGVLLTTKDPDTMLKALFEKIKESLSLDVYFNFMVRDSADVLELVSCAGVDPEISRSFSRLEFGQAVCGNVAVTRAPIVATHIQQSSEPMAQLVKGLGLRAY
ncbi:MAG TPA: ATP-binding protein, partial [Pyrinomonadaceae bacterium]|nr:ATP-binding protein [Pyrinomonadaceae bacterium]